MKSEKTRRMQNKRPPTRAELYQSRILVLGMGRAGSAAASFLLRLGARVTGYDADPTVLSSGRVKKLMARGLRVVSDLGRENFDWVVVSPGVAEDAEPMMIVKRCGLPVVDELDLASVFVPGEIVAVTGTNGKSTTTTLIARMLENAGRRVFVGGNLAPGKPLSTALSLGRRDYYVAEVSSFQLERSRWLAPEVAVILNITSDHLNRHGGLARYRESKFRILDRQSEADLAVLNRDDPIVMRAQKRGRAERLYFSLSRQVEGAYLLEGWFCYQGERIAPLSSMRLRGEHNVANALAAICVARSLGVTKRAIRKTLSSFVGLPHRLETVRRLAGVEFVNNSMCTNPVAGIRSLRAVALEATEGGRGKKGVILITGGREKGLDYKEYLVAVRRWAKWVVLFGENARKLAEELASAGFSRHEIADELRQAVELAWNRAERGDIVLFSPAFASFDRFRDFQQRGNAFRREVSRLA